jgi:hypothetical protein
MTLNRNKNSKKKQKVQDNRAEDDKFNESPQSSSNDYDDFYKQELEKTEKELTDMRVEFNREKGLKKQLEEEKRKLDAKVQKLEGELLNEKQNAQNLRGTIKREYEKQLEKEKQEFGLKLKNLETKVRKLEGESLNEKQNTQNLRGIIKREYEGREKERQEFGLKSKNLEAKIQKLEVELSNEKRKTQRQLEREKQEFDPKLKNLEEKAKYYQQNYDQLKEGYDRLQLAKKNMETDMENNINNLDQQLRDQEKNFKQQFMQVNEKYKKNINNIKQKLDEKGNGLRELEDENLKLREEASKYQSALGVATNIRLGDGDQNHSVKLKQDILKLQVTLENYVTHLKPNMNINIRKVQELARKYGCLNKITAKNPNKLFIKAVLQRKVLDLVVYEFFCEISKFQDQSSKLESDIDLKANELLNLIRLFSTTRVGTDEVIDASIVKIRQQVYGILGNRGFNNIIDNDGNIRMHDFIAYTSKKLNKIMSQYREIKDINRKEQVDAMAPKLIQDIYKIFWFRANVQEPKIIMKYFLSNRKIDPNMMQGTWNDDEINKLRVDICYFPLVGRNFNSSDVRIYTPAKVFPRDISASNETNDDE